jgi:hypothetical protein
MVFHIKMAQALAAGAFGRCRRQVGQGEERFIKTTDLADYVDSEVPLLAEKVFKRAQFPTISISGQPFHIGKTQ